MLHDCSETIGKFFSIPLVLFSYGGYGGGSEYGGFPNPAGGAQQQPPQPPQMSTQVSLNCACKLPEGCPLSLPLIWKMI